MWGPSRMQQMLSAEYSAYMNTVLHTCSAIKACPPQGTERVCPIWSIL